MGLLNEKTKIKSKTMKTITITILFTLLSFTMYSQISLDNTITGSMYSIELEGVGKKYFVTDFVNNQCIIYNTDYSTYKTIDISVPVLYWLYELAYVSTKVFDNDDEVELLAVYQSYVFLTDTTGYYVYHTRVINEDGSLMLDVPSGGYSTLISNGPNENKLLMFVYDFSTSPYIVTTNIYSIYGVPVSFTEELSVPGELNSYPNPARNQITIPYKIDGSETNAWIVIRTANGIEVAKYQLNANSTKLSMDVSGFSKGIYFYNLQSGNTSTQAGKFIVH